MTSKLDPKVVHEFWSKHPCPNLYRIIASMESTEHWTLDENKEFEEKIIDNLRFPDNYANAEIYEKEEIFFSIFSALKMGRAIRFLQLLENTSHGAVAHLLTEAINNKAASSEISAHFIEKNVKFNNLQILGKVFSKEAVGSLKHFIGELSTH